MSNKYVGVVLCSLFTLQAIAAPQSSDILPTSILRCKVNNDYGRCLTDSIQELWSSFVLGVPELGMPTRDPLRMDEATVDLSSEAFSGHLELRNIRVYGLAGTRFARARTERDGDEVRLSVLVRMPKVLLESDYLVNGTINSVPIAGQGFLNVSMTGVNSTWIIDGTVTNDHFHVEHFRYDETKMQNMTVYFSDFFNGSRELNEAALRVVNDYWDLFIEGVKPIMTAVSDPRVTSFFNREVFSRIRYSTLFKDDH